MSKIYETKKERRTIYLSKEVNQLLIDYAYEHYHKQGKSPNYSEIVEEALKEYLENPSYKDCLNCDTHKGIRIIVRGGVEYLRCINCTWSASYKIKDKE